MKVYITVPFTNGENKAEIERLCSIVKSSGFDDFCFVRDMKAFDDPKELMVKAREEIQKCDVLLFDASVKSTGRAIEVGIAYSLNKKIIVIIKEGAAIKDNLQGVADSVITYKNIEDIQSDLTSLYSKWH